MTSLPPEDSAERESDQLDAEPLAAGGTEGPSEVRAPRGRLILQVIVVVVILAVVGTVIAVVIGSQNATSKALASSGTLGPANMASGGVLMQGSKKKIVTTRTPAVALGHTTPTNTSKLRAPVNIVEYVDLQCPYCLEFEETNLNNVASWVAAGQATLEVHPIAFLDASSQGTRYSSRADNAVSCVANYQPDNFLDALAVLYEFQPAEATPGLTNAQILAYLRKAGVASAAVTRCVDDEEYAKWVEVTTEDVEKGDFAGVATTPSAFQGTPTVFVNGAPYTGSLTDASTFTSFVNAEARS